MLSLKQRQQTVQWKCIKGTAHKILEIKNNAISGAAPQDIFGTGSAVGFPRGEFTECFRERPKIPYIVCTWYKGSLKTF